VLFSVLNFLFLALLFLVLFIESDVERNKNTLPLAALHTLYLSMENKRHNAANTFLIASTFRFAIFAIVVVLMPDYPAQQIQVLLASSWCVSAVLMRMQPYSRGIDRWTVFLFESVYAWCLALCLMFTPEYSFRSYAISKNMGFAICTLAFIALGVGLILIIHSACWQVKYYESVKERAAERAEAARRRILEMSMRKQLTVVDEASADEQSEESQRNYAA